MSNRSARSDEALLALRQTGPTAFAATVPARLCVGMPGATFLLGGCLFAAGVEALERAAAQPAILVSAQFTARVRENDVLAIDARVIGAGRFVSQARVAILVDGEPVAHFQGAAGQRDDATVHQGEAMPVVPPAAACVERSVARLLSSNVNDLFAFRLAAGVLPDRAGWTEAPGQDLACWVALRSGQALSHLDLAVIADCAAIALPGAIGRPASGSSLDNAMRFVAAPDGPVVLMACTVEAIRHGLAHITTRLFSPAGRLLAVAQQTMILRAPTVT